MDALSFLHDVVGRHDGTITLWQMVVRAIIVFFFGVALLRLTTPRLFGKATPLDIVLAIIIGSNLSRTLTGNAPLVEVLIITVLLVVLHALLARVAMMSDTMSQLVKGRPCELVERGEIDWKAMKRCAVGERDLMKAVREAGGTELGDVKLATLERGGDIEVVLKD